MPLEGAWRPSSIHRELGIQRWVSTYYELGSACRVWCWCVFWSFAVFIKIHMYEDPSNLKHDIFLPPAKPVVRATTPYTTVGTTVCRVGSTLSLSRAHQVSGELRASRRRVGQGSSKKERIYRSLDRECTAWFCSLSLTNQRLTQSVPRRSLETGLLQGGVLA